MAAVAVDTTIDTADIVAADRLAQVSVCLTHNIVIAILTQAIAAAVADTDLILPRMSNIESRS